MTDFSNVMGPSGAMSADGLLRTSPGLKTEGCANYLTVSADGMQSVVASTVDKCLAIRTDRGLNDKGRATAFSELLDETNASIDEWTESEIANGYEARSDFISKTTGNGYAKFRGGDIPGAAETRAMLYAELKTEGGDLRVQNMVQDAARAGDVTVLAAAADAPSPFPLVSAEILDACEETYRRTIHSKEAAEQDEIQELLDALKFNATGAKEAARKLSITGSRKLVTHKTRSW